MTYYELVNELIDAFIIETSPENSYQEVTIQIGDEFYPIEDLIITDEDCDILDPGHLVLKVKK